MRRAFATFLRRYLILSGIGLNLLLAGALGYGLFKLREADVSVGQVAERAALELRPAAPGVARVIEDWFSATDPDFDVDIRDLDEFARAFVGANRADPPRVGRSGGLRAVPVADSRALAAALRDADAGQAIVLEPGTYRLSGKRVQLRGEGSAAAPIAVLARRPGAAVIELDTVEGFFVNRPHWVFQNLVIKGVCENDDKCEHAFHVVGNGHHTAIRNNRIVDFNSAIKINGSPGNGGWRYPDQGVIEGNAFYNTAVRRTANPVTVIDAVAASEWEVRRNFIADFHKGGGNRISYGGFFKGNGETNTFERNLVACSLRLDPARGTRVGLSFGGGGSGGGGGICRGGDCGIEQTQGTMRNNLVVNCNDVGIYLNEARFSEIYNNTLINTLGIDIRFDHSNAIVANNFLTGRIRDRNGGESERISNLVVAMDELGEFFVAPGRGDFDLTDHDRIIDQGTDLQRALPDYCGRQRGPEKVDIGAFEYDTAASTCNPFVPGEE